MKTAQAVSRPRVQNGTVNDRRAQRQGPRRDNRVTRPATRLRVASAQAVAPRPRRREARQAATAPMPNGLSVMGLLVSAGAAIALMLVVALGWQRNAYAHAQQEVELRSALDQTGDERQQLLVDQRRVLNPRETAARGEVDGLNAFKLDERTAAPVSKSAKPPMLAQLGKQAPLKTQIAAKTITTKSAKSH